MDGHSLEIGNGLIQKWKITPWESKMDLINDQYRIRKSVIYIYLLFCFTSYIIGISSNISKKCMETRSTINET